MKTKLPDYEYMIMFRPKSEDAKATTIGFTSLKMFTTFAVQLAQNGIPFAPLTRGEAELQGYTCDQIKNEFTTSADTKKFALVKNDIEAN